MKITNLTLQAEITLNNREAELLEYLTSYSLAKWFAENASHRFTEAEISEGLKNVRSAVAAVTKAYIRTMEGFKP